MSGEESSARRRNFCLDPQRPFEIEHVQPALEHVDERAQLVVRGDQLARLRDGFEREFVFAGHLRDVAQLDRQELAVGRGPDRLLGDDLHLARRGLEQHADGNIDVDVAVDADLAADRSSSFLTNTVGLTIRSLTATSWASPRPRDWPKGKVNSG